MRAFGAFRLAGPSDLDGLRFRAYWFRRSAVGLVCLSCMAALGALAIRLPDARTNDGFHSIYTTFYLTSYLTDHKLRPTSGDMAFYFGTLFQNFVVLAGFVLVCLLLFLGRKLSAIVTIVVFVLFVRFYNTLQYSAGLETLAADARTERILNRLDPADPALSVPQHCALIFAKAQSAYLRGDAVETTHWLNVMPTGLDLPLFAVEWRLAVMQDWARAHGQTISPKALQATNANSRPVKRIAAAGLWGLMGSASVAAIIALALAIVISRRSRRIASIASALG